MRKTRRPAVRWLKFPAGVLARVANCPPSRSASASSWSAGAARAGDDDEEDDDKTFEEKIIDSIMRGIGATNMEKQGYRIPRALAAGGAAQARPAAAGGDRGQERAELAEGSRRGAPQGGHRGQRKKDTKTTESWQAGRPLTPAEMKVGRTAAHPSARAMIPFSPAYQRQPDRSARRSSASPAVCAACSKGGSKPETKQFKSEPHARSLTQPPPGYQTPSPSYAYGTGPRKVAEQDLFRHHVRQGQVTIAAPALAIIPTDADPAPAARARRTRSLNCLSVTCARVEFSAS